MSFKPYSLWVRGSVFHEPFGASSGTLRSPHLKGLYKAPVPKGFVWTTEPFTGSP